MYDMWLFEHTFPPLILETRRFTNVGGIEVFEETFGW